MKLTLTLIKDKTKPKSRQTKLRSKSRLMSNIEETITEEDLSHSQSFESGSPMQKKRTIKIAQSNRSLAIESDKPQSPPSKSTSVVKIERYQPPIEEVQGPTVLPDQEDKAMAEMNKLQTVLQDIEEEEPILYSERKATDPAELEGVQNFTTIQNSHSKIIVAEDQMINMQVIKSQLNQLGLAQACDYCYNGEQAVDQAIAIIDEAVLNCFEWEAQVTPICLMLLDFQMPRKNGLQVVEHLRQYIHNHNRTS